MAATFLVVTSAASGIAARVIDKIAASAKLVIIATDDASSLEKALAPWCKRLAFVTYDDEGAGVQLDRLLSIAGRVDGVFVNDHASAASFEPTEHGILPLAEKKIRGPFRLLQALLRRRVLGPGSRVVYSCSEAARGIEALGYAPPCLRADEDCFRAILTGAAFGALEGAEREKAAYAHLAATGALAVGALARRHPDVHFATVSPGLTRDSFDPRIAEATAATWAGRAFLLFMRVLFPLLVRLGSAHGRDVAAGYYARALTGDDWEYPSGAFVGHMPPKEVSGPLGNQADVPHGAVFADEAMQDSALAAVLRL